MGHAASQCMQDLEAKPSITCLKLKSWTGHHHNQEGRAKLSCSTNLGTVLKVDSNSKHAPATGNQKKSCQCHQTSSWSFDLPFHRTQNWQQTFPCTIPEWYSLPKAVAVVLSLASSEFRGPSKNLRKNNSNTLSELLFFFDIFAVFKIVLLTVQGLDGKMCFKGLKKRRKEVGWTFFSCTKHLVALLSMKVILGMLILLSWDYFFTQVLHGMKLFTLLSFIPHNYSFFLSFFSDVIVKHFTFGD